jgi:hypothetical protein
MKTLQETSEITSEDRDALRRAVKSLDHPSLAARLTDLVGKGIEALESALFLERLKLVFFFRLRQHVARLGLGCLLGAVLVGGVLLAFIVENNTVACFVFWHG